jgi:hypothetical protein
VSKLVNSDTCPRPTTQDVFPHDALSLTPYYPLNGQPLNAALGPAAEWPPPLGVPFPVRPPRGAPQRTRQFTLLLCWRHAHRRVVHFQVQFTWFA